ncbi:unnamed protein product [Lupinus luteus]|uniref:Uncharacterized protein n=1 Tax=Lupinus luteus TaxID=3873 RepID=A0AAV1XN13_LUPLU
MKASASDGDAALLRLQLAVMTALAVVHLNTPAELVTSYLFVIWFMSRAWTHGCISPSTGRVPPPTVMHH